MTPFLLGRRQCDAAGNGYYRNEPEGVGLYFRQGKVMQICLLPKR